MNMDEKEKEVLKHSLVRLVKELNPQLLLPHLPCLTLHSREKIEADQRNEGKSYAVNTFYEHLIRRRNGFKELVGALRDPCIDCSDLADDLTASLDNVTGGRCSPSSRVIRGRREVPNGANVWTSKFDDSSGQQGGLSCATEPLTIDTQWRNLSGKIPTILRKFDTGDGLKKPADLAGLLDFTVGEIDEIKARTSPGDSLTVAIITCQAQRSPVTLGDLFKAFYDLGRIDILNELEETTGVTFKRPAERGSFRGIDGNHHVESESLSRMERDSNSNRNRIDAVNINLSAEKPVGYKKAVTNEKECQVSKQTAERLPQNYVLASEDSKLNIVEALDNCKLNVKDDERSLKVVSGTDQGKKGWFNGYKPEEILNNMEGIGTSPLGIPNKMPEKKEEKKEFLSSLPCVKVNRNGNDLPSETQQDEGDEAFVNYENDLGRSNSSCSSNTDNNDSLNCQPDDLPACDSEKIEIDNKSVVGASEEKINTCIGNIGKCHGSVSNYGDKQLWSELEVDADPDNSENYLQLTGSNQTPNGTSDQLLDESSVKAEFDKILLEEKLKGGNLSNICTVHSSVKGSLSSIKSRNDRLKQGESERTFFMSAEHYVDHSLEDNRIPIPKLTIGSQDMQSIERKAGKNFPGGEKLEGNENDISYQENSDGSYDIHWDLSERGEALSTDGEQEWQGQEIRDVGLTEPSNGQYFVQAQDVENRKLRMKDQEQIEVATVLANRNNELDVKEPKEVNQGNTCNSNIGSKDFEKHDADEKSESKCFGTGKEHVMLEDKCRNRHKLFKDGKLDSSDVERQDSERVTEGTGHKHNSMEEVSNENRPALIIQRETNSSENEIQAGTNQRLQSVKDFLKKCFTVLNFVYENSV